VYNYDAYFLKGMCYKDMGDTVSATSSFQTAARINPENPDPYLQLGLILANTDEKQAKLYLESAFKADTNNVEPLNAIGLIYQGKKENAAAKNSNSLNIKDCFNGYTRFDYSSFLICFQNEQSKNIYVCAHMRVYIFTNIYIYSVLNTLLLFLLLLKIK
jgi:tetratricopeptide (TPR) repeat protein